MPSKGFAKIYSFKAGAATVKNYVLIQDPSNTDYVIVPTANNMNCIGYANDAATAAGDHIPVQVDDAPRFAVASGGVTKGDLLMAASGGAVMTATTSGTIYIVGVALETAVTGATFRVLPRFDIVSY